MPSTAYSTPSKLALITAWGVFSLSSIVTVISAARLPADGACWNAECLCFMVPALILMFISVHYLNKLNGNNLLYSAHRCAQTTEFTERKVQTYLQELHLRLRDIPLSLATQQAGLALIEDILHHSCYPLSQPVLRAQIFVLIEPAQARRVIDNLSRIERLLNRAWSALSDGYETEARTVCREAEAICADLLAQLSGD